jgi:hypothetical protein
VTFSVTTNTYGKDKPRTWCGGPHHRVVRRADPLAAAGGWYNVSVTASARTAPESLPSLPERDFARKTSPRYHDKMV